MKKIRVKTYDDKGYFDSDIDYLVTECLLNDDLGRPSNIESKIDKIAALLGVITDSLIQSEALDIKDVDSAIGILFYDKKLVEVEEKV